MEHLQRHLASSKICFQLLHLFRVPVGLLTSQLYLLFCDAALCEWIKASLSKVSFWLFKICMSTGPEISHLQPLCSTLGVVVLSHLDGMAVASVLNYFFSKFIITDNIWRFSRQHCCPQPFFYSRVRVSQIQPDTAFCQQIDPSLITPLRISCHLQKRFEIGLFPAAGNLHFITQIISLKAAKKDCGL